MARGSCPFRIGDWVCLKEFPLSEQPYGSVLDISWESKLDGWSITIATGSQLCKYLHTQLKHWMHTDKCEIAEDLKKLHGIDVKPNPFIPPGEIVISSGKKEIAKITNVCAEEKEIKITRCIDLLIDEI